MNEGKLTLLFAPEFRNVDMVRAAIAGILQELTCHRDSPSSYPDFCLAITEAMNNGVEHSGTRSIEVELTTNGTEVTFRMFTGGKRFDPTIKPPGPASGEESQLKEGGYGLMIIHELVDDMHYEYSDNRNILTLKKKL